MHWFAVVCCFLAVVLFPGSCPAQGGPPLITDDPGTPGDGHWEINFAFAVEKRATETLFEAPILDINYGWGERTQLKFEIPWIVLHEEGNGTKNGLGNSVVGVKWRFIEEEAHGFAASVYPQLEFNNPTSSHEWGLVDEGTVLVLPIQLAKGFGPFGVNVEVGYAAAEKADDEWLYGLALGYDVSDRLELLGEVHGVALSDFEESELVFNLGGRWRFSKHFVLIASAGRGIQGSEGDEPELLSYLGVQFLY